MSNLNLISKQLNQLDDRIAKLEKQGRFDLFSKIVFPLVSLIVAGLGSWTAWNALKLSRAVLDLNIEPVLNVFISVDYTKMDSVSLVLINEGVNDIRDIHIKKGSADYDFNLHRFESETGMMRDWKLINALNPRDSVNIGFPKPEIDLLRHNAAVGAHWAKVPRGDIITIAGFEIRYRRTPDAKRYFIRKYLYVLDNILVNPDEPLADEQLPLPLKGSIDSVFNLIFKQPL